MTCSLPKSSPDSDGPTAEARRELLEQVQRCTWVHTIDLGNGLVTQGRWGPPDPLIKSAFDEIDFAGKKVLDIGCWDGLWSFEAEKRGAVDVYATDYRCQRSYYDQPTFQVAHRILGSKARYYPDMSVYDITDLQAADFDVVVFTGVYYHLKHPLLAFSRIRTVMKEGGILIVEGPAIDNLENAYATFHYRHWFSGDPSNWWTPTIRCLREWIECSFFDIIAARTVFGPARSRDHSSRGVLRRLWQPFQSRRSASATVSRWLVLAKAVRREDPNYVFPDEDLAMCDLKQFRVEHRLHGLDD